MGEHQAAHAPARQRTLAERLFNEYARPWLRDARHRALVPGPHTKRLLAAGYKAHALSREAFEWAYRGLVATPTFLALCAEHGERVAVDRIPYISGRVRLELGSDVRISGRLDIIAGSDRVPTLRLHDGAYLGHGTTLAIGQLIEIGRYSAIGPGCYIADTDGHSHTRLDIPIWADRPAAHSVAPVIIEDNVHVARGCIILKGVRIGARSLIGAGAVVRSDVAPGSVIMGNPGRPAAWRRTDNEGGY